jgi:hypothetical protein
MRHFDPFHEIKKLTHGESWVWPESDYGRAEIWLIHDEYILFEIPMYGGPPRFSNTFNIHQIEDIVKTVESWT